MLNYHLEKADTIGTEGQEMAFRDGRSIKPFEATYHAPVSYAEHHGEIDLDALAVLSGGCERNRCRRIDTKTCSNSCRGVAGKLTQDGNGAEESEHFKVEAAISRQIPLQDKRIIRSGRPRFGRLHQDMERIRRCRIVVGFWAVVAFGFLFRFMSPES